MLKALKILRRNGVIVLLAACLALSPLAVSHADSGIAEASIRIEQSFTIASGSSQPPAHVFTYYLEPVESTNPMPSGTRTDGRYYFQISGNQSTSTGPIQFDRVGSYQYRVTQDASGAVYGYTYDMEVYTVTIFVGNSADGIVASVYAPRNSAGYKESTIQFSNSYNVALSDDPKTGDSTYLALWAAGMLISLLGFLTVILVYRRIRRF